MLVWILLVVSSPIWLPGLVAGILLGGAYCIVAAASLLAELANLIDLAPQ